MGAQCPSQINPTLVDPVSNYLNQDPPFAIRGHLGTPNKSFLFFLTRELLNSH